MKKIGKALRSDFPIFKRKIHGNRLVYLDSAATSQKPDVVIDSISDYYCRHNANIHRGVHTLAEESSEIYESARRKVAKFIGAKSPRNIIFTRNATEGINLVSYAIESSLENGDILTSKMEHHSNFVPWQRLARKKGRKLAFVDFDQGKAMGGSNLSSISHPPSLLAISHASNVLGTINDIRGMARHAKENWNCPVLVDAAQSAPHIRINVNSTGCDFLAFSGHKMLAPNIGALYISDEWLERLPPFLSGGGMISDVFDQESAWADAPQKFEAGTPDVASACALSKAISYLEKIGMGAIAAHEQKITKLAMAELEQISGIRIFGPKDVKKRTGVVSFAIDGIHPHDLGTLLDRQGIAIRAGHHCAKPLMRHLGVNATSRASFYLYNDSDDVFALADGIRRAKKLFGV